MDNNGTPGKPGKYDKAGCLYVRCAETLGEMKLFSEQVEAFSQAGYCFMTVGDFKSASLWFENARDVSAQHGFASTESNLCLMLGTAFAKTGRFDESVQQHRRAVAVAESVSPFSRDRAGVERSALRALVEALCIGRDEAVYIGGDHGELEGLIDRLREMGDNNADCWLWNLYLLGMAHLSIQGFSEAASAFRAAVEVAAEHPEVLNDPKAENAFRAAKTRLKNACDRVGDAPSLSAIVVIVQDASTTWSGVLLWESRLEELLFTLNEAGHPALIQAFASANLNKGHFAKAATLFERRVQLLGKMLCFRDQSSDMCTVGECFLALDDAKGAESWYQKARALGAQHGFFEAWTLSPEP